MVTVENNIRSILEMTDMSKEEQRDKLESLIRNSVWKGTARTWRPAFRRGEATHKCRCLAINPQVYNARQRTVCRRRPIAVEDIQEVVYKLKSKIGILITTDHSKETLRITDRATPPVI